MLDFDPRDSDSRDEERHANTPSRGGRGGSDNHDRDYDWGQPGTGSRDRDDGDTRSLGRGPGNGSDAEGRDRDHDPRWTDRDRIDGNGRVVLLYLATDPWTDRFRTFLQGHARLLSVVPTWTIRLAFPHPLEHFYSACQSVIHDEFESPLHPATIGELQWFFEHRRQSEAGEPLHPMTKAFLNVGHKVFGTPRFTEMHHRWRRYGHAVFDGISSPTIAEAMEAGRGTVKCLVLTQRSSGAYLTSPLKSPFCSRSRFWHSRFERAVDPPRHGQLDTRRRRA